MVDGGIGVVLVTHLFDLADTLRRGRSGNAVFLRAERLPDGRRTFRLGPGDPQPTSNGADLSDNVFGEVARKVPEDDVSAVAGAATGTTGPAGTGDHHRSA